MQRIAFGWKSPMPKIMSNTILTVSGPLPISVFITGLLRASQRVPIFATWRTSVIDHEREYIVSASYISDTDILSGGLKPPNFRWRATTVHPPPLPPLLRRPCRSVVYFAVLIAEKRENYLRLHCTTLFLAVKT